MENNSCEFLRCKSIAAHSQNHAVAQALNTTAGSQEALKIKDHPLWSSVRLAAFPKQGSLQWTQLWWEPMSWHYSDRSGSKELSSERGTGVWQWPSVFSCWLSISRRLLDKIPSDISGFFSRLVCMSVCVRMWLGRKYFFHCYIGKKQRKTSLREKCKAEYIFLLTPHKSLPGQTSIVLNILPNKVKAKFCSCIQGFSVLSSSLHLQRNENLCCVWKRVTHGLAGPPIAQGRLQDIPCNFIGPM